MSLRDSEPEVTAMASSPVCQIIRHSCWTSLGYWRYVSRHRYAQMTITSEGNAFT